MEPERTAKWGASLTVDVLRGYITEDYADELAALREDKARLDLLDRNALNRERTLAMMERGADHEPIRWAGIEWDGRETTIRAAIDFHRNL